VRKGTGIDKSMHHRYTTGGKNDRSCPYYDGEGTVDLNNEHEQMINDSLAGSGNK